MNPRIRKMLAWVGYPVFYFACLMVFAYVSAPWDRLKDAVTSGFNTASPLRMEMDKLSWSWRFPGITASGVRFVGAPGDPDPSGKPKPPAEYHVDDFYARVSVLPLLWGTSKLGFALDGFGGVVDGTVKTASDGKEIELELDKVDAAKMPYLADVLGIPLAGAIHSEVDFKLPEHKLSKADGRIEMGISDLEIGDGKTKIRDTIALPKVRAGEFTFKADVTEGIVKITEFTTKGPDLEVVAQGRIRLNDRLEASLLELDVRYKFSDAYRNKDDTTRGLFGTPGASVPGLFDLDPKMKRAKRDDGFYAWHVTGPMSHLNFQPGAPGGVSADSAASRVKRPAMRAARTKPVIPAPGAIPPPPPTMMAPPAPEPEPAPAPPPPVAAPPPPVPPAPAAEAPDPGLAPEPMPGTPPQPEQVGQPAAPGQPEE